MEKTKKKTTKKKIEKLYKTTIIGQIDFVFFF